MKSIVPLRSTGTCILMLVVLLTSAERLAAQAAPVPAAPVPAAPTTSPASKPPVAPSGPAKPAGPLPADAREVKPEVYFVRDKDGNLVPVPDFSYEEFKRLYDLDQKLAQAAAPPTYVIQGLNVSGTAGEELADLDVRVRWVIKTEAWIRIPLRLSTGILRDVPTYDGPGEHFVEAERGGGFAVWVRERDPAPHTLALRLRVPLKRQGDEQQLSLPAPIAAISEMKLTIARPRVTASITGGGSLLANEHPNPTTTLLAAAGLGENFQLAWRLRENGPTRMLGAVEATSNVEVRVEGPRRVSSEARLRLRGLGGGLDVFRVRLPAGMEFVPSLEPGYTVELVESIPGTAGGRPVQVVEVRLDNRSSAAADVRIRATLPLSGKATTDDSIETLGFEVVGAVRQSGQVDVFVDGEWALVFNDRSNVQSAELPDTSRQQGVVARFEFHRQPCSLIVQIQLRKSRVQVEPTYVMTVGSAQVRLQANLNYRLRGSSTPKLQLDMAGWSVDRVEPARLMATAPTAGDASGILTIPPPVEAGLAARDFEVQVFAHLDISPEQPLALPIPRPITDGATSAIVVVAPDDNVSLAVKPAEMAGLVPELLPPTLSLPARLQTPLYYRVRLDAEPKRFVADLRLRPRAMSVAMRHLLRVTSDGIRADHRLLYLVAHEPVTRLHVKLGRELPVAVPPQFFLDTGAGPWTPLAEQAFSPGEGATPSWILTLPEPRLGGFSIVVRTHWPLGASAEAIPAELVVPLVVPEAGLDTTVIGNELRLIIEPPWRVELAPQDWRAAAKDEVPGSVEGEVRFVGPETAVAATLHIGRGTAGQSTFWVQNAWIQTWLGRTMRHDRGVWKLVAHDDHVDVQLPSGTDGNEVLAAVDGVQTAVELDAAERVRIPLRADGREHVVEVSCFLPRRLGSGRSERFELPRLLASNSTPRFLWQLVTPRDEHLVLLPSDLIPELQWNWRGGIWERQAAWRQAELERWSGATAQEDLPTETNQYLFSGVGTIDVVELRLWPRDTLLIAGSAAALAAGLLLLYVRPLRHPLAIAIAGLALLATSLALSEAVVVLAQATLFGWALAMLARVLRGMSTGRPGQVVVRNAPRSSILRGSTKSHDEQNDRGAAPVPTSTTETATPSFATPAAPKA